MNTTDMGAETDDFDVTAAFLRRFQENAENSLHAFATRMAEALPGAVSLDERSTGIFRRTKRLVGLSIRVGERDFVMSTETGRLVTTIRVSCRNVVIRTDNVSSERWFAQLDQEIRRVSDQARDVSTALRSFLAG